MVSAYVDKCRAALPALKTAVNDSEFEFLRVYGHRLKGSGGAYGFPALTTMGASIEQAANGKNTSELRTQAAALEAYLGRIEVVAG
jgi:HPt (histidine-containing phosphotransfer) domain-containing protein